MKRSITVVFLLFAFSNAQLLTSLAPYPPTPCKNNATNCYTSFPYPYDVYARAGDPVLLYGATAYLDLCKDFKLPLQGSRPVECSAYFCTPDTESIYNDTIAKMPTPYKYHLAFTHYCYYCDYNGRSQFYGLLQNTKSCAAFWEPPINDNKCGGDNIIMDTSIVFTNYNRQKPGRSPKDISEDALEQIRTTKFRFNAGDKQNLIEAKVSNSYWCYCKASNRFGIYCDSYTDVWIPFRYNGLPFITMTIRVVLFIVIFAIVLEPKIENEWRETMGRQSSGRNFLLFLASFFTKLPYHVIFFMKLGIVLLFIENISPLTAGDSDLRTMNGNFRVLAWFSVYASYFVLLVVWANIYERSSNMRSSGTVALKYKIIVGIFYVIDLVICVAGMIVINIIQFTVDGRYYLNIARAVMDCLAFSLTFLISFGFLIYGCAMYRILRKVDKELKLWKVRFTQFMLLTVPAMWLTCAWLLLYVVHTQTTGFGPWMNLYFSTIIDAHFLLLYILMIFVLFDRKTYANSIVGRLCCSIVEKAKRRKEERQQKRNIQEEHKKSLLENEGGQSDEDMTE